MFSCPLTLIHWDIYTLLRLLLLAPLLEEWILRAGLQAYLLGKYGRFGNKALAFALVAPALLFGLLHIREGMLIAALTIIPGLLLGWLFQMTRKWTACALAHAAMNGGALAFCGM